MDPLFLEEPGGWQTSEDRCAGGKGVGRLASGGGPGRPWGRLSNGKGVTQFKGKSKGDTEDREGV